MNIRKAGIIRHPDVEERELIDNIIETLKKNNIEIFFDIPLAKGIGVPGTEIRDMDVDVAITIGGDGTILWTLNELRCNPLILAINAGRFGFLSELKRENAVIGLNSLIKGKFRVDSRTKIKINDRFEALNEVSILPEIAGSLLEFEIKLNDEKLDALRADGVIVSTQTGSTAYNLSAGGPIIQKGANVFAVTPVNPFMHTRRTTVVSEDSKIYVKLIRKDRNAQLLCDGILKDKVHPFETVTVEKSEKVINFVRF